MCEFIGFITAQYLLQAGLVAEVLEILVVLGDAARVQELDHSRIGQRIEIAAQHQLDVARLDVDVVLGPERLRRFLQDTFQLVAQHHRLDEFHVAELRIPMDVRRTNQQGLLDDHRIGRSYRYKTISKFNQTLRGVSRLECLK